MLIIFMSIIQLNNVGGFMKDKFLACVLVIVLFVCTQYTYSVVHAEQKAEEVPVLDTDSVVSVSEAFGEYQSAVDENIYYSLTGVNADTLISIFGNVNTPMFNKAKECINPCMAFATTWGEAGAAYKGISLTTVMDFNPNTYVDQIDWLTLSKNLEQVDAAWYTANARQQYNTNAEGYAYHIPNALLQVPKGGDRSVEDMENLGVGAYQITSSNWNTYDLDGRVNPVWGFENSIKKCGTSWYQMNIDPISDLTVYAALSLSHQGGSLPNTDFGIALIECINKPEVQDAINKAGRDMFYTLHAKAFTRAVSLSDIDVAVYMEQVEQETGIDFSMYHRAGYGSTNKGNYVLKHCIRYVFYKYYYTSGQYNESSFKDGEFVEADTGTTTGLVMQSDYVCGTHEHITYKQTDFIHDINGDTSIAGAGCGWCALTMAMAELNPTMCGGISPSDWLTTPMVNVGEKYWTGDDGMWYGGVPTWIEHINATEIYGTYAILEDGGLSSKATVAKIMEYAGDTDKVVLLSTSEGLFTNGGHIIVATDLSDDGKSFHVADSSTVAAKRLGLDWEDMNNFDFPGINDDGSYVTSINGFAYNFKHYWVIQRED